MAKINLKDVTFIIPVMIDTEDRRENLDLVLKYLLNYFDTNIIVKECDDNQKYYNPCFTSEPQVRYIFERKTKDYFHRTRLLNDLIDLSTTKFIFNYDADVLLPIDSYVKAIELLRSGDDLVYPYTKSLNLGPQSSQVMVNRNKGSFKIFKEKLDITILNNNPVHDAMYGFCCALNRESYIKGFKENENFKGYCPDDYERQMRFEKFGMRIGRVEGQVYHIEHLRTKKYFKDEPNSKANHKLFEYLKALSREQLIEYYRGQEYCKRVKQSCDIQVSNVKNIVVCGAGGFIGNHMVTRLKEEGHYVIGIDLKKPQFSKTKADKLIIGDLRNLQFCDDSIPYRTDEIYQFAAWMGGAGFVFTGDNDADIMHNSATINLNMLEICRKKPISKILYSSSACAYPKHNQLDPDNPNCEESSAYPANPDSEYGWEKLFSERLYFAYARNYGVNIRVLRYHNIFGIHGTFEGGREKAPAALCRKVAQAQDGSEIEVWGDGKQTRSFLYISDCIEATRKFMDSNFSGPVNIGSEEMISINNLAKMIIEISGKNLTIKNIDGPVGVRGRNSCNRLYEKEVGNLIVNPLRVGVELTYNWINEQVQMSKENTKGLKKIKNTLKILDHLEPRP